MLSVAHRAGNDLTALRAALATGVDLIEADVHLYRGALEVRHSRTLGPRHYWDRTTGIQRRRDVVVPNVAELLEAAGDDPRLMLDLKGRSVDVAHRVAAVLRAERPGVPTAVCTKQWAMLDAFAGDPHIRRIYSAANRSQLNRLRARLRGTRADGVSIRLSLLTAPIVAELRHATDLVLAWSVDTTDALAHARTLGVTGVISKDLTLLTTM